MTLPSTCFLAAMVLAGCALEPPRAEDDPNAHIIIAELALARGQGEIAAEEYQRASEGSSDVKLAGRAAQVALESGRDDLAELATNRWLALDPENPLARRSAGLAALRMNRLPRAFELLDGSLTATAEAGEKELAELFATLANEANGYGVFVIGRGLAAKREDSAQAQYAAAAFALAAYNYAFAAGTAQRALDLKPDQVNAKRLEARALVMSGETARGLELARQASADGDIDGRLELAMLSEFAGDQAEARRQYQSLLESEAGRGDALYELALLDFREHKYDEAARGFTELLTVGRQVGAAFYYLGSIAERRGDRERAIRFYSRIVSGNFAVDAQLRTARLLGEGDLAEQGEASLETFASEHPEFSVELAIGRSRLASERLQHRAALGIVDAELGRYPGNLDLIMQRALVLDRAGRVSDAVRTLRDLLRERPDDPVMLNALGYTLVDHDQSLGEGEALIRRANAMMPDSPAILDSLGWAHFRRARYAEAAATLRKAYDQAQDPEIAAHLGEALWKLGEREKARDVWQEALAMSPTDPYLNSTLRRYAK
ncbi:MAG TPA: tetratricopeptide repeat protein [Steroidobacteraceae bacterium]|nr:tetratricopeptide repeat protein [Steroidobacteraceae bacterium]